MIDYGGGRFRFVGRVDVEHAEIKSAIEVTRTQNAVLVGAVSVEVQAEVLDDIAAKLTSAQQRDFPLLPALIHQVSNGEILLARGFGEFDDVQVGVEVFGDRDVLDRMERTLSGVR